MSQSNQFICRIVASRFGLFQQIGQCLAVVFTVFALLSGGFHSAFAFDELLIQGIHYDQATHQIRITSNKGQVFPGNYTFQRYNQPDRLVVTLPKARLAVLQPQVAINQYGIRHVELIAPKNTEDVPLNLSGVQLVVVADQASALENVKLVSDKNTLTLQLPALSPVAGLKPGENPSVNTPMPRLKSVVDQAQTAVGNTTPPSTIRDIHFQKGILTLTADQKDKLKIKQHFTLDGPNRLVVDVDNAVLANKDLSKEISVMQGPLKKVRVGQFEADTVRIVLETESPDSIAVIHPHSRDHQLAFMGDNTYTFEPSALDGAKRGVIEDIQLVKQGSHSYIKIFSSTPMAHKVINRNGTIEIELANVVPKSNQVPFDPKTFKTIKAIQIVQPPSGETSSNLRIELSQQPYALDSHMSFDGKYLEIAMEESPVLDGFNLLSNANQQPDNFEPVANVKGKGFTVVVDAGHGGKDRGANRAGINEKEITLSVALKLKKALEAKGVKVYMTRSTDEFLPLSTITSITNRIKPDAFVSVHVNASVKPSIRGIETYYYHGRSLALANRVHKRFTGTVTNSPDRGVRRARFYVINHTPVPAILCEIGYISNDHERGELVSQTRQNATAESISEGVVQFLNDRYRADAPDESATPARVAEVQQPVKKVVVQPQAPKAVEQHVPLLVSDDFTVKHFVLLAKAHH